MLRSLRRSLCLLLVCVLAGCATRRLKPLAIPAAHYVGALALTPGIRATPPAALAAGFTPDLDRPPQWLNGAQAIAVSGTAEGRSLILGFDGSDFAHQFIVAEDAGRGAPNSRLLDVAVSPDSLTIATVSADPTGNRVQVVLLSSSNEQDDGRVIAEIPSDASNAQLAWFGPTTLLLVLRTSSTKIATAYRLTISDQPEIHLLDKIDCASGKLQFSRTGRFAIADADAQRARELIDWRAETCQPVSVPGSARVLAWAPDESALLYSAAGQNGIPGIYRYDRATGNRSLIAISSRVAGYANDGTIIAIGNNKLTWRGAAAAPDKRVVAQVALMRPGQSEVTINSLGFEASPTMLAQARGVFADDGKVALDITFSGPNGPIRELIEYSYPARAAFVLATVEPSARLAMSWSPDPHQIAIEEVDLSMNSLSVINLPE